MGLWEDFGASFQVGNPMPNIPNNPGIHFMGAQGKDLEHVGTILSPEDSTPASLPGEPLRCFSCLCWQRLPGLAYWSGRCAATGRKLNMQSRCDMGFEERPTPLLPKRTAPQTGARHAYRG